MPTTAPTAARRGHILTDSQSPQSLSSSGFTTLRGRAVRGAYFYEPRMARLELWPGAPYPLGATFDGSGTNFSIFSEVATRVELSLFNARGREQRVDLPERTAFCFHGYLPARASWPALRLSRARSRTRPPRWSSLQPGQALARSVRSADHGRADVGSSGLRLSARRSRRPRRTKLDSAAVRAALGG